MVAVGEESLFGGFGILAVGEGAYLDVLQLVLWLAAGEGWVAFDLEGVDEEVGVFGVGEGGYLDDKASCRRRDGVGCGLGRSRCAGPGC